MEQYFIIYNSDGDTHVSTISKDELLKRLEDDEYGQNVTFLETLPKQSDTNYWGEGILIIKGSIVAPTAKEVITKYDIK